MTPNSDLQHRTQAAQQQTQQRSTDVAQRSQDLARTIEGARRGLAAALADRIGPERFIRAAVTSIRTTPKLAEATDDSILGALFVAAQLGLEVGGPRGLVYLVPYYNKKLRQHEAQLVVGYRGWVDLIYRAGARSVQWFLVREGDLWQKGSGSDAGGMWYRWAPLNDDESRPYVRAVAQVQTGTGGLVWLDMTREQIMRRATDSPIWRQWPEEMALKTVLRAIPKLLATSTEQLALATSADETVQHRVEVPGLPPEQRGEHLPVLQPSPAPPQRPTAPPPPRPRDDAPPETAPEPVDNEPDDDWEARERAEAEAYFAQQQDGAQ